MRGKRSEKSVPICLTNCNRASVDVDGGARVYLFGSQHHRDHTLGLGGLSALINEDGAKLHLGQTRVTSSNAGTADDVSILKEVKHNWVSVQVHFFSRAEKN